MWLMMRPVAKQDAELTSSAALFCDPRKSLATYLREHKEIPIRLAFYDIHREGEISKSQSE
ncbi:hypothetical protein KIN20_034304 [Parelaphostrongylus tenuis]|uniref:Uncharacterized protein n=1 Tax=Parelaphostrongylus tenuis TaxID=148309 RepID=A0AAD5RA53_PARTN|nr:hypothetical protein KIN20_034304 [Parelaphostrongylus tenuis]